MKIITDHIDDRNLVFGIEDDGKVRAFALSMYNPAVGRDRTTREAFDLFVKLFNQEEIE